MCQLAKYTCKKLAETVQVSQLALPWVVYAMHDHNFMRLTVIEENTTFTWASVYNRKGRQMPPTLDFHLLRMSIPSEARWGKFPSLGNWRGSKINVKINFPPPLIPILRLLPLEKLCGLSCTCKCHFPHLRCRHRVRIIHSVLELGPHLECPTWVQPKKVYQQAFSDLASNSRLN